LCELLCSLPNGIRRDISSKEELAHDVFVASRLKADVNAVTYHAKLLAEAGQLHGLGQIAGINIVKRHFSARHRNGGSAVLQTFGEAGNKRKSPLLRVEA